MIYLASPYSTPKEGLSPEERYQLTKTAVEFWLKQNYVIFSSIVYTHILQGGTGASARTWKQFNDSVQSKCSSLWVLKIDGWDKSEGVKGEIEYAKSLGQEIAYIELPCNSIPVKSELKIGDKVTCKVCNQLNFGDAQHKNEIGEVVGSLIDKVTIRFPRSQVTAPRGNFELYIEPKPPKFDKGDRVNLEGGCSVYVIENMTHNEDPVLYGIRAEDKPFDKLMWVEEISLGKVKQPLKCGTEVKVVDRENRYRIYSVNMDCVQTQGVYYLGADYKGNHLGFWDYEIEKVYK